MKQKSRSDLGSDIVARIKAMIFSGELLPGQQIRQEEFAQQFGISRTPLLHALQVLKSEMLVESYPNRGTFVRTISLEELKDIFEYREAIEAMACRLASQRIRPRDIKQLRDLFKPFFKKPELTNLREYKKADQQFHRSLINHSGNTILPRMVMLGNILLVAYQKGLIRPPVETLPEHLAIIEALQDRDPRKAEKRMRSHLQKSVKLMYKTIQKESTLTTLQQ
jgi:DNA-binding GntR family transcriptional regulator